MCAGDRIMSDRGQVGYDTRGGTMTTGKRQSVLEKAVARAIFAEWLPNPPARRRYRLR
jgi:hypothetical protein